MKYLRLSHLAHRNLVHFNDSDFVVYFCWGSVSFPWFFSPHSKDLKWWTSRLQLSFTKQRILEAWRQADPQKRGLNLGFSFYTFCLLSLSLPCVNWASQEGSLFHLRFSLQSSDFLRFHFHRLFPFFVF